MDKPTTSHDLLPDGQGFANVAGNVRATAASDTPDAELYRIVAAHALREGRFQTKAEFDAKVRSLGTVAKADEVIAFRELRPGCDAFQIGERMMCDCGVTWKVDAIGPTPYCRKLPK